MTDEVEGRRAGDRKEELRRNRSWHAVIELFTTNDPEHAASDAERQQAEFERDRLIELAARAEMWREDSPFYTNEKLIAWIARDLREQAEVCGSVDEAMLERVAGHVYDRVRAAAFRVKEGGPCPASQLVDAPQPLSVMVEELASTRLAPRPDLAIAAGAGRELWEQPCESVLPLPFDLPGGRHVALRVDGDSMMPFLHAGDVVLVRVGTEVERDTLIVARGPDEGYVVKRVGRLTRHHIELRSLNPDYAPIAIPREPGRMLGTVVLRWCDHDTRRARRDPSDAMGDGG